MATQVARAVLAADPGASALHRFARLTAGATLFLIFAGGLVTSTGSGLAVPDWPLSFGQVFPEMTGGVLFEHGHRLIASAVGLLTLVLATWIVLKEDRPGVRALGVSAVVVVMTQGILGGVTVLYQLPPAVSVVHACLAQAFLCLTVALAVVTGPGWAARATVRDAASPARLALATTAAIYGQLILGAVMRHTGAGLAIPDFPLSFGRLLPPLGAPAVQIHFAHRLMALVVFGLVVAVVSRALGADRWLHAPARAAAALVAIQVALGATTVWSQKAVLPATAHVFTGAALLAASLVLTLRARRLGESA